MPNTESWLTKHIPPTFAQPPRIPADATRTKRPAPRPTRADITKAIPRPPSLSARLATPEQEREARGMAAGAKREAERAAGSDELLNSALTLSAPGAALLAEELAARRGARAEAGSLTPRLLAADSAAVNPYAHLPEPPQSFHGTNAAFEKFDPSMLDRDALYGPGMYFTDSRPVANGYAQTKAKLRTDRLTFKTLHEYQQWAEANPERLAWGTYYAAMPMSDGANGVVIDAIVPQTPNIRMARVALRNPFNIEGRVSPAEELRILEAASRFGDVSEAMKFARASGSAPAELHSTGDGLYETLVRSLGDKAKANDALRAAGYDGIKHVGGRRMGGPPHNVSIAFDREQVRSPYGEWERAPVFGDSLASAVSTLVPPKAPKPGPNNEVLRITQDLRRKAGVWGQGMPRVTEIDKAAAQRMAKVYEALPANDPNAKAAYDALNAEVAQQAQAIHDAGYTLEFVDHDPYKNSAEMMADVRDNKRLRVLKTNADSDHPYMTREQNDQFRAVHDFFAHAGEGHQFGPVGEENAYRVHASMLSPLAQRALATETRGQNSWVNFGPNAHLPVRERPFAEQKAALWPADMVGDYHEFAPEVSATGVLPFEHYSQRPDLTTLDPAFMGTGRPGVERRDPTRLPSNHVYALDVGDDAPGHREEQFKHDFRYTGTVPAERIYNANADPHGLIPRARNEYGVFQGDTFEKLLRDAGFLGYRAPSMAPSIVKVFEPVPVQPATEPATSRGKPFGRVPPSAAPQPGVVLPPSFTNPFTSR